MHNQKFAQVPTRSNGMEQYSKTPQPKTKLKAASLTRSSVPEVSAYYQQPMMAVPIYFDDQKMGSNTNKQRSVGPRISN